MTYSKLLINPGNFSINLHTNNIKPYLFFLEITFLESPKLNLMKHPPDAIKPSPTQNVSDCNLKFVTTHYKDLIDNRALLVRVCILDTLQPDATWVRVTHLLNESL